MKIKIINKLVLLFTILFISSAILVLPACQVIKDLDIIRTTRVDDIQSSSSFQNNTENTETASSTYAGKDDSDIQGSTSTTKQGTTKAFIEKSIPGYMKSMLTSGIKKAVDASFKIDFQEAADTSEITADGLKINFKNKSIDDNLKINLLGSYILVPAGSFYTYCDDLKSEDFIKFWQGDNNSLNYIINDGSNAKLILDKNVFEIMENVLGKCKIENLEIVDDFGLIRQKLAGTGNYFSIIPFEEIVKEYKIFNVDGESIFDKKIDISSYPFAMQIVLSGKDSDKINLIAEGIDKDKITNRRVDRLAVVNMTGVTALVRGVASKMDRNGILYPGEKIAEILKDADVTHISNEITFVEGNPRDREDEIVFSSDPGYIDLLRFVGADVIELTGNHMNDYGPQWMVYTLEMYEKEGWQYFAGGRNLEEAYSPARFDINGNRIAFMGCNQFGPASSWATDKKAGSAPPTYDVYEEIIKRLKDQGYNVIFTFQHIEVYDYLPVKEQMKDFRRMAAAGADIVSGSQAHQPQAIEFYNNGAIFYGLGNLFFDQMYNDEVRQGIITKHIFYEGRYINTVLITTMLEDYCQPRLTDAPERLDILEDVFDASMMKKYK